MDKGVKIIAQNKKAWHDYFIEDKLEVGIALTGTEVKSIRMGKVNLKDSHAAVHNGELFVYAMHISPYEKGNIFNKDPLRIRKLLAHKREILKLQSNAMQDGYSLIPLELYLKNGKVKMQIGVAKGKKLYDKRDSEIAKESKRKIERALKSAMY